MSLENKFTFRTRLSYETQPYLPYKVHSKVDIGCLSHFTSFPGLPLNDRGEGRGRPGDEANITPSF